MYDDEHPFVRVSSVSVLIKNVLNHIKNIFSCKKKKKIIIGDDAHKLPQLEQKTIQSN